MKHAAGGPKISLSLAWEKKRQKEHRSHVAPLLSFEKDRSDLSHLGLLQKTRRSELKTEREKKELEPRAEREKKGRVEEPRPPWEIFHAVREAPERGRIGDTVRMMKRLKKKHRHCSIDPEREDEEEKSL